MLILPSPFASQLYPPLVEGIYIPLDSETRDTRLLGENIPADLFDDRFGRWVVNQSLVGVLVVDIVADADELAVIVGAGQEDDSNANDFGIRDLGEVWRVGLEDEFVDADGDWANK